MTSLGEVTCSTVWRAGRIGIGDSSTSWAGAGMAEIGSNKEHLLPQSDKAVKGNEWCTASNAQ